MLTEKAWKVIKQSLDVEGWYSFYVMLFSLVAYLVPTVYIAVHVLVRRNLIV